MRRPWLILLAGAAWASTTTVSQFVPTPFDPAAGGASGTATITISASCVAGGNAFIGGTVDVVSFSGGNFAVNLPPTDACPTQGSTSGSAWSSTTAYVSGTRVQYAGQIWLARVGNTGTVPGSSPATWLDISPTYTVRWFVGNNSAGWTEQWAVPTSSSPVTIDQVRLSQPAVVSIPTPGPPGIPGAVQSFSTGSLTPLFTAAVANATSYPALSFTLSAAAQNAVFIGPVSGGPGAPTFRALQLADIPDNTAPHLYCTFNSTDTSCTINVGSLNLTHIESVMWQCYSYTTPTAAFSLGPLGSTSSSGTLTTISPTFASPGVAGYCNVSGRDGF